tara:strand:- start:7805 stop:7957 length:153 start_codon:yes stop_codon:yes gene_type:complete
LFYLQSQRLGSCLTIAAQAKPSDTQKSQEILKIEPMLIATTANAPQELLS